MHFMQRLNHHHLFVFWTFGKTLSFTKAAETLAIAQSAVTSQVKKLEEALEIQLVDRTYRKRPRITDEGRKVIDYADSIFESSDELVNWATKGSLPKNRVIRIGALAGLSRNFQFEFIEPLIKNKQIKFEITTGDLDNLIQGLSEHRLDVVLSSRNADPEHRALLRSHVLTKSPLVFVVEKKNLSIRKRDLNVILQSRSLFTPGKHFESKPELEAYLGKFKSVRVAGEIDDVALLRILALRSGEVVVMPEMGIRNEIAAGEVAVLFKTSSVEQKFYAITRQKREPNSDVRYLIERMQTT